MLSSLDFKQNGRIKVQGFIDLLKYNGIHAEDDEIKEMFALADSSGEIGVSAFRIYILHSSVWKEKIEAKNALPIPHHYLPKSLQTSGEITSTTTMFNVMDKNKDGFVEKEDFAKTFHKFSNVQVEKIYNEFDEDLNGKMDYKEFKRFVVKNKDKSLFKGYSSVPPPSRSSMLNN